MKITKKIITAVGGKETEIALRAELQTTFGDASIQGYQAAGQLEKIAKNVKRSFLSESKLNELIVKHKTDIEEQRHFTEEGLDCFIRTKLVYNFEQDEQYNTLKAALDSAKEELEQYKKEQISAGNVPCEDITYTFECHGEKF